MGMGNRKMNRTTKLAGAGLAACLASLPLAAFAEMVKAPDVAAQAAMMNKGDTAWMLVSSALVLMMSVPALALFYGGLVRSKNMLSVLMQVFMIVSMSRSSGSSMATASPSPAAAPMSAV